MSEIKTGGGAEGSSNSSAKKSPVKVVVRFRPLNEAETETDQGNIDERPFEIEKAGIRDTKSQKVYTTISAVCDHTASQEEIYVASASGIMDDVFDGYNAGIFCYGQSGGGKSYSLFGKEGDLRGAYRGVLPRSVHELCARADQERNRPEVESVEVHISFFEIYLEEIYDLLLSDDNYGPCENSKFSNACRDKLPGREDRHMKTLRRYKVDSIEEAIDFLEIGLSRRRFHPMPLNPVSSRSHAVFSLHLHTVFHDMTTKSAVLHFADLMGSEALALGFTDVKETASVNQDLLSLSRVIESLGPAGGVPSYRSSTLSWVLRDVLGGNAKTVVMCTCSPSALQYYPSRNTLLFGERCTGVIKHIRGDSQKLGNAELRAIIQRLQKQMLEKNVAAVQVEQTQIELQDLENQLEERDSELKTVRDRLREEVAQRGVMQRELEELKQQHAHDLAAVKLAGGSLTDEQQAVAIDEALAAEHEVAMDLRAALDVAAERCAELESEVSIVKTDSSETEQRLTVQVERERQNTEGLTRICELRSGELEQVLDECDMLRKENTRLREVQVAAMEDADRAEKHERETLTAVQDVQRFMEKNTNASPSLGPLAQQLTMELMADIERCETDIQHARDRLGVSRSRTPGTSPLSSPDPQPAHSLE